MVTRVKINMSDASVSMNALSESGARAIARATTGRIWIVFIESGDAATPDLLVAFSDDGGATWTEEVVVANALANSQGGVTLLLDSADVPHVVYLTASGTVTTVRYTNRSGGAWAAPTTVVSYDTAPPGDDLIAALVSAAIDSADDIHAAFLVQNLTTVLNEIHYSRRTAGVWGGDETVDADGENDADFINIVVDSSVRPSIMYRDNVGGALVLRRRSAGWSAQAVIDESANNPFIGFSSTIDQDDVMHFTWMRDPDPTTGTRSLMYRQRSASDVFSAVVNVDPTIGAFNPAPLLLNIDSDENAWIFYQQATGVEVVNYAALQGVALLTAGAIFDTDVGYTFPTWAGMSQRYNANSISTVGTAKMVVLIDDTGGDDADLYFYGEVLAIPSVPGAPAQPEPPGGSFNRLTSGGAGGFLAYITPDGRAYPFHTPHEFGRWVVSFSGFGTPPIQYITERGPFQHGETVRDFFLRPRVIQLLIRQGFCDRVAWWGGRADLLNEIRPNRQATPTAALPGELRVMETDGTLRSLNVFIQEGPRFEPRVSSEWDEWAFQEVLRFIAYDPVAFDPTQVTAAFAVALEAQLVFPITFPIRFGTGVLDETLAVTYPGTWLTFPIITITGPIELPRLDNVTTGEKIEFGTDIAAGRTITIDLTEGNKTVVDDLGNNLIGTITSDSDLGTFHLAPDPEAPLGANTLRLRGTNPTGATAVSLAYFVRYFGF